MLNEQERKMVAAAAAPAGRSEDEAFRSKLAKLEPVKPTTDPVVVELLRDMLKQAENGEILSVVIVGERCAGGMTVAHSYGAGSFFGLVGALSYAQAKMNARQLVEAGEVAAGSEDDGK